MKTQSSEMKKNFFGLALHFSKIELLPVVLVVLNIVLNYQWNPVIMRQKKRFFGLAHLLCKNWTFAGCSRFVLDCSKILNFQNKTQSIEMKKKNTFFGMPPPPPPPPLHENRIFARCSSSF